MNIRKKTNDLKEQGYCCTGDLLEALGLKNLSANWIEEVLGISPVMIVNRGQVKYYHKVQISDVRRALIFKLLKDDFEGTP